MKTVVRAAPGTDEEVIPVVRCNIYSLVCRSRIPQRAPWNHVVREAWSSYHKSQLTGTGSKVPPDLLSMLRGPLLLWKVHNRSCKWSLLFLVEEEVEKGKNSGAGILYPHSYRVKSEIHPNSGSRAGFGLCKFWAKVAFWSNGRTNGRSVKCQSYRSSQIKVQELSAAGQWNGSRRVDGVNN